MGNKPDSILCEDIDSTKYYICECEIFLGGDPLTGCSRPYMFTEHTVVFGASVKNWVCYGYDCTDDKILICGYGDAQRLIRIVGPYDERYQAELDMW